MDTQIHIPRDILTCITYAVLQKLLYKNKIDFEKRTYISLFPKIHQITNITLMYVDNEISNL